MSDINAIRSFGTGSRGMVKVMTKHLHIRRSRRLAPVVLALMAAPAWAQGEPSANATVNLIRLLTEQKIITADAGKLLLEQAEAEARQAQAASASPLPATAVAAGAAVAAGTVRVPYVPQVVRDQIRAEVKADVLAAAKTEGWAAPNSVPGWVNHIRIGGDLRIRNETSLYSRNNTDQFVDFAAFNANGPTNITPTTQGTTIPLINSRTDRNFSRLRARLSVAADITDGVLVGFRLASGDQNSPVSTNQLLGGGFTKKNIWLDQAYVTLKPGHGTSLTLGRMPNPFRTTELLYDEDVNFDGVAANVEVPAAPGLTLAATAGAFPFDLASNTFPTLNGVKTSLPSRWLFAGQIRADWMPTEQLALRLGVGYNRFEHVQGQLSALCAAYLGGSTQCSTDPTRPAFLQKGNTLFLLRNLSLDPSGRDLSQPQFAGLAVRYEILDVNVDASVKVGENIKVSLAADYVRNLGFKAGDVCRFAPQGSPITNIANTAPVGGTNVGVCVTPDPNATVKQYAQRFQSGREGFQLSATVGYPAPKALGEWKLTGGYRRVEPDAVLDGLADSDFHQGGTNAKGYFVAATVGLFKDVRLTGRYLSANEVYGPPLAIDVVQVDLNVSF